MEADKPPINNDLKDNYHSKWLKKGDTISSSSSTTTTTTIVSNFGRKRTNKKQDRHYKLGIAIFLFVQISLVRISSSTKNLLVQQQQQNLSIYILLIACSLINVISHTAVVMGILEKNHISIFAIILGVAFDLLSQLFYIMGLWIHIIIPAFLEYYTNNYKNDDEFQHGNCFFNYSILLHICLVGYHLFIHTRALCMTQNWKRLNLVITSAWNNIHGNPGLYASDHFFAYSDLATHTYTLCILITNLQQAQDQQQQPLSSFSILHESNKKQDISQHHHLLSQRQITILNNFLWILLVIFLLFITILYLFYSKNKNHCCDKSKNEKENRHHHHHHGRIHKKHQLLICPCHICQGKTSFSISWITTNKSNNIKTLCFCDLWYSTFLDLYEIMNNNKKKISMD